MGSKTAPLESDLNFEIGNNEEILSTYNYYIYYNSVQSRDPRLKKPTYVPDHDMEFHKENENNQKESQVKPAPIKIITKDVPVDKPTKDNMPTKQQQPSQTKTNTNNNTKANAKPQTTQPNSNSNSNSFQQQQNYYLNFNNPATIQQAAQNPFYNINQIPLDPNIQNNYMNPLYLQNYMQMLSLNDNINANPQFQQNFNPFAMGQFPNQIYPNPFMMNLPNIYAAPTSNSTLQRSSNKGNSMNSNNPGHNRINKKHKGANGNNANNSGNVNRPQIISRFQNLNLENTTFQDILKNVCELSKDPSGSRLVQKKYEECTDLEKEKIINKVLPDMYSLSKDIFGNYVVQKFMESSSKELQEQIISQLKNKIKDLTIHMYGCRVIQKAIDLSSSEKINEFLSEMQPHLKTCIEDANGNHVVQKIIESLPPKDQSNIVDVIYGHVYELSIHQYGCRVIQKIYDYSNDDAKLKILDEIYEKYTEICQDQYGNYVIQNILHKMQKGTCDNKFFEALKGKVYEYSLHKFASNVIEACLGVGNEKQVKDIVKEMLIQDEESEDNEVIVNLVKDKYGNYVIQKMIEVSDKEDKEIIIQRIVNLQAMKKRDGFSKHVMNFIEKMGLVVNNDNGNNGIGI